MSLNNSEAHPCKVMHLEGFPRLFFYPFFAINNQGMIPKLLDFIKIAFFFLQNVNDNRPKIQKYPSTLGFSLNRLGLETLLGQRIVDPINNCPDLGRRFSAGDDKVVG